MKTTGEFFSHELEHKPLQQITSKPISATSQNLKFVFIPESGISNQSPH